MLITFCYLLLRFSLPVAVIYELPCTIPELHLMFSLMDKVPSGIEPMLKDLEEHIISAGLADMVAAAETITTVSKEKNLILGVLLVVYGSSKKLWYFSAPLENRHVVQPCEVTWFFNTLMVIIIFIPKEIRIGWIFSNLTNNRKTLRINPHSTEAKTNLKLTQIGLNKYYKVQCK